jgi:hypothetical protein
MLTTNCRAANDLDFKAVTQGRGSLGRNLAVALTAGMVVGGIAYAFSRSWWIAVTAGVGLFAISVYSNLMFFRRVRRYEFPRTDSKAVEILEVSADRILDVEPVGDNAPAFCFFVVYTMGDDLYHGSVLVLMMTSLLILIIKKSMLLSNDPR